ncbi:hypothetical protein [Streptomyces mirabilis]|uniref:hypothetical protein n=1 Tax=Streptomyces mirabilis TaxID=68239 RepID=UPI0033ABDFCA
MDLMSAVELIQAPLSEHLARLSSALAETIPHREIAQLAGNCSYTPFKIIGESPGRPGDVITATEVAALRPLVPAKGGWQGRARMAGVDVPVLALVSDITGQGALLVLVRTDDTPVPEEHVMSARALWDLVTAYREGLRSEPLPGSLAASRAAAAARAVAIAELRDAHGAALTTLIGVLRDRALDDTNARTRAVDLAVSALAELRSRVELDRVLMEERAGDAFDRLAVSLRRSCAPAAYGWSCDRPTRRKAPTGCSPPTSPTRRSPWSGPPCTRHWTTRCRVPAVTENTVSTSAGRSARTNCAPPCGTTGPAPSPAALSTPAASPNDWHRSEDGSTWTPYRGGARR